MPQGTYVAKCVLVVTKWNISLLVNPLGGKTAPQSFSRCMLKTYISVAVFPWLVLCLKHALHVNKTSIEATSQDPDAETDSKVYYKSS